jgi:hypothetical protein
MGKDMHFSIIQYRSDLGKPILEKFSFQAQCTTQRCTVSDLSETRKYFLATALLLNFGLENSARKIQENGMRLQFSYTYQILDHVDSLDLPGDNIQAMKEEKID